MTRSALRGPRRARAAVLLGGGGGVGDGASDAGARALLSRCARRPGVEGTEALRSRVSRGGCPRIQEEGRASTRVGAQAGVRGPRDAETQASVWVRARGRELGVGEDCSKLQGVSAPGCRGLGAARAALRGCSGVAGLLRQAGGWRVRMSAGLRRGAQALRHGWARSVRRRRVATWGHLGLSYLRLFL